MESFPSTSSPIPLPIHKTVCTLFGTTAGQMSPSSKTSFVSLVSRFILDQIDSHQSFQRRNSCPAPILTEIKSLFHSFMRPPISFEAFVDRLFTYSQSTVEMFLIALIYLNRLRKINPSYIISRTSVFHLLLTSVMVSSKFFEDKSLANAYFASIGGINDSINLLEVEFLFLINFNLCVSPEEFCTFRAEFVRFIFQDTLYNCSTSVGKSLNVDLDALNSCLQGNSVSPCPVDITITPTPMITDDLAIHGLALGFKKCVQCALVDDPSEPWVRQQAFSVLNGSVSSGPSIRNASFPSPQLSIPILLSESPPSPPSTFSAPPRYSCPSSSPQPTFLASSSPLKGMSSSRVSNSPAIAASSAPVHSPAWNLAPTQPYQQHHQTQNVPNTPNTSRLHPPVLSRRSNPQTSPSHPNSPSPLLFRSTFGVSSLSSPSPTSSHLPPYQNGNRNPSGSSLRSPGSLQRTNPSPFATPPGSAVQYLDPNVLGGYQPQFNPNRSPSSGNIRSRLPRRKSVHNLRPGVSYPSSSGTIWSQSNNSDSNNIYPNYQSLNYHRKSIVDYSNDPLSFSSPAQSTPNQIYDPVSPSPSDMMPFVLSSHRRHSLTPNYRWQNYQFELPWTQSP